MAHPNLRRRKCCCRGRCRVTDTYTVVIEGIELCQCIHRVDYRIAGRMRIDGSVDGTFTGVTQPHFEFDPSIIHIDRASGADCVTVNETNEPIARLAFTPWAFSCTGADVQFWARWDWLQNGIPHKTHLCLFRSVYTGHDPETGIVVLTNRNGILPSSPDPVCGLTTSTGGNESTNFAAGIGGTITIIPEPSNP
jgi:hypothetical protein